MILISQRSRYRRRCQLLLVLLVIGGSLNVAQARKLIVANNGVDGNNCGDPDHPCRSISKAIHNAGAGDVIVVGPGRYGDVNGNGSFDDTEVGDEAAEIGTNCNCLIKVDKQVTIISRDGAFATILDASGTVAPVSVVQIEADGSIFGTKKKGFTITGGSTGISITSNSSGVKVVGNIVTANTNGIMCLGSENALNGNLAVVNTGFGFSVGGQSNVIVANTANLNHFDGFIIHGSNQVMRGNTANANAGAGFNIAEGGHHAVLRNSTIGNQSFGMEIGSNVTIALSGVNIYGNNSVATNGDFGCGFLNDSGLAIIASNAFWGAASGPGGRPADNVCNGRSGSTTWDVPLATGELKIKPVAP